MQKALRLILKGILFTASGLLLLAIFTLRPIDRTPVEDLPHYQKMQEVLSSLDTISIKKPQHALRVGASRVNITPDHPTAMAGVGIHESAFESVHDSIFVRAIVLTNGTVKTALISADLLLIPPAVTRLLEAKLSGTGYSLDNVYLSATHTHSSIGNWAKKIGGRVYAGKYDEALVDTLASRIARVIMQAETDLQTTTISFRKIPVEKSLVNRLADEQGKIDSLLRVIEFNRIDGQKYILTSFTGHATCNPSGSHALSGDYPGALVRELENSGYTFAMFMAGAVGSHACTGPQKGEERIGYINDNILRALKDTTRIQESITDSSLCMIRIPLHLGEPHLRIAENWETHSWVFRLGLGEYPAFLTALKIGDLVMLGTPCDFSGELSPQIDSVSQQRGIHAMVTSFNGGYIGYITRDKWYDLPHYETREMNWYGPGNGQYVTESLIQLMEKIDR